jgi:tRNA pseudouridine38-40 synthase
MVRRLVGVIVEVGRGGLTTDEAVGMLSTDSELPARLTAPASGLFLEQVHYDGDPPMDMPAPIAISSQARPLKSQPPMTQLPKK